MLVYNTRYIEQEAGPTSVTRDALFVIFCEILTCIKIESSQPKEMSRMCMKMVNTQGWARPKDDQREGMNTHHASQLETEN